MEKQLIAFVREIQREVALDRIHSGYSVYTGTAGIAHMFFRLAKSSPSDLERKDYFNLAKEYLDNALDSYKNSKSKPRISFLEGPPGIYAQHAILSDIAGNKSESMKYIGEVLRLLPDVMAESLTVNEMLYGRSGYLWSLQFLFQYFPIESISDAMKKVCWAIIEDGTNAKDSRFPLMFQWHEKNYFGAAHGITGIVFQLLQCHDILSESDLDLLVRTINKLGDIKLPSGNYPSSKGKTEDRLVQWCHGAPGFALMYCKAFEVFKDPKYLQKAIDAAEVVHERGLLKKGLGLCHGVAGNGYVLLYLYHYTKDKKWLERTMKFCEFCMSEEGLALVDEPDRPFSLFEGIAGTICFFNDVIHHDSKPTFPCFDL